MANRSISRDDAVAQASDSLQAAYFRGALADLRATLTAVIARQNGKLATMSTKMNPSTVSRLRREIRDNESEMPATRSHDRGHRPSVLIAMG